MGWSRTDLHETSKYGVRNKQFVLGTVILGILAVLISVCLFSLRRRFEQNQQDISFTIMALLPSLGQHILDGMDVEGVTQELQSYSRSSGRPTEHHPQSEGGMPSSLELRSDNGHDARSEVSSLSMVSGPEYPSSSQMAGSSHSWVDQFSAGQSSTEHSQAPSTTDSDSHHDEDSPKHNHGPELSDSIVTSTDSSALSYEESTKVCILFVYHLLLPVAAAKKPLWCHSQNSTVMC